jgi:proteasome lid subunit RPN8/RPN11
MLRIPERVYQQLRRHGEETCPHECCGVLLGVLKGELKEISTAIPVPNASPSPGNHYEIAPVDLIRVEREARVTGAEIIGFYHSHPDHPAQWSPTDLAEAHWLGCSYVITEIRSGKAVATNAFRLAGATEEDKRFEPEEIQIGES